MTASRAWIALALGAAALHGAVLGWGTWGDVAGDTGRELEIARLLAEGRRLYVDVAYYYGPLAPYLNALLTRLFGAHLDVFVAAGLASAVLAAAGLAAIVRPLAGSVAAAVTGVAFAYCCAFAHLHYANVFNWVLPYGFPSTYGMLCAIWSVERLLRHLATGRTADLAASIVLLAAAALAKAEAATAALPAHVVVTAARLAGLGVLPRAAWAAYGAALVAVGGVYGFLLRDDPAGLVRANFVDVLGHPAMRGFVRRYAGLDDPAGALWTVAGSALALAAVAGGTLAAAALARRGAVPARVAAGIAAGIALIYLFLDPSVPFAVLPLIGVAAVAMLTARMRAGGDAAAAALPALALWAAALGCLARIPLATSAQHYGFYLLPLPLAAFAVWWWRTLPAWLGLDGEGARIHRVAGAALLLAVAAAHARVSAPLFAAHTVAVEGPRGGIRLLHDLNGFPLGRAYADTIAHLATYPAPTRVLVAPTGSAMPYLAGLESAGDRTGFMPAELDTDAETHLLATLAAAPPDLVVSLRLDVSEWGSRGFGVDYGRRTWAWIRANYEPSATFGPEALVLVLRRRAAH